MKLHLKICLQIMVWLWFDQVLQDVSGGTRPTLKTTGSSFSDPNLMFEILLRGVAIDQDNNVLLLDEEMASLRKGREFLSQINDGIPKSLSSMVLMVSTLEERQRTPLTQVQLDNVVLSMAYSAHQAMAQKSKEDREAWGGVLLQLANITVYELRGTFLFNYA
ncbi:protein FAM180A [Odontesthes bonariensis]|uniref:protein FAM180A n=1 Tax=Odontesthes bonariensis TaxID=219752 RepID=UPI003F58B620